MQAILSIEWMKVKKYRTFWILSALFLFMLPAWNYGLKNGVLKVGGNGVNILNQVYSYSYVWENIGYWTSLFVVFLSVLVIILTTNEYQYKTNRQNVIDGWSRLQFFHAKWGMVVVLSLLTTLYVFINGVVFAAAGGSMSGFPGHIEKLFYTFVLTLNYFSFSLLLAFIFKRSGITIGIFFLYSMFVETLLKSLLNWKLSSNPGNFLPLQCSDELLPFPLMDMLKAIAKMQTETNNAYYVIASFVWIIIYYLISRRLLLKSDW